jgi:hypothetical protein
MTILQATTEHIEAILLLQEKYHVSNLTEAEKQEKGFVTMKVSYQQFEELIAKNGVFIAITEAGQLAAYALSGDWAYFGEWAIIQTMEKALPSFSLDGQILTIENTCHYGPVCIDEAFRGQDILTQLFSAVQAFYAPQYHFVITFINKQNVRSSRAHARRTPLSIVGEFEFNSNHYFALAAATQI